MSIKGTQSRLRYAACVVYPESAPANWIQLLEDLHINVFISPLHDHDTNPDNDEPKKPHYHVLVMFDSMKSRDQIQEVFDLIAGVGFEVVSSLRGYARYLCHLDNPEKYQYKVDDVTVIGCEDYASIIGLPTDKYTLVAQMLQFCNDTGIIYFSDLLEFASENNQAWFRALCDNSTVVLSSYFRSKNAKYKALNGGVTTTLPHVINDQ